MPARFVSRGLASLALSATLLSLGACFGPWDGNVTIEDPLGRKYGVTSNEAAMFDDLEAAGIPAKGYVPEVLRLLRALCNHPDDPALGADRIESLIQVGFTEDQVEQIGILAERHDVCADER